jgi:hypothetical protein
MNELHSFTARGALPAFLVTTIQITNEKLSNTSAALYLLFTISLIINEKCYSLSALYLYVTISINGNHKCSPSYI